MNYPRCRRALVETRGLERFTNSSPDHVLTFIAEEVERWTPVVAPQGLNAGF